jgi:hypothetical protein
MKSYAAPAVNNQKYVIKLENFCHCHCPFKLQSVASFWLSICIGKNIRNTVCTVYTRWQWLKYCATQMYALSHNCKSTLFPQINRTILWQEPQLQFGAGILGHLWGPLLPHIFKMWGRYLLHLTNRKGTEQLLPISPLKWLPLGPHQCWHHLIIFYGAVRQM